MGERNGENPEQNAEKNKKTAEESIHEATMTCIGIERTIVKPRVTRRFETNRREVGGP